MHKSCANLRMIDRCVQCNPGYSDPHQATWIRQQQKRTGSSLEEAEKAYVRQHVFRSST